MIIVPPKARPKDLRNTEGITLVRQPDHAALSAHVVSQWQRPVGFSKALWNGLLEAILHHDDGWIQTEIDGLLDKNGRPRDFQHMPLVDHIEIWRRSIALGLQRSELVGTLIAGHARWLHTPARGTGESRRPPQERKQLTDFLAELDTTTLGAAHQLESIADTKALDAARRLLSFADGLGLILLGAIDVRQWPEEIPVEDSLCRPTLDIHEDFRNVHMTPWPFVTNKLRFKVAAQHLSTPHYAAPLEFQEALEATPAIRLGWELRAGKSGFTG